MEIIIAKPNLRSPCKTTIYGSWFGLWVVDGTRGWVNDLVKFGCFGWIQDESLWTINICMSYDIGS